MRGSSFAGSRQATAIGNREKNDSPLTADLPHLHIRDIGVDIGVNDYLPSRTLARVQHRGSPGLPPRSASSAGALRLHAEHITSHCRPICITQCGMSSMRFLSLSFFALFARRAHLGTPALPSAHTHSVLYHALTHHAITQEAQTKSTPPWQNDQENVGAALRRISVWNMEDMEACADWGADMCNMTHCKTAR